MKKNKNAGSADKKNILPIQLGSSLKRINNKKPTSPASPASGFPALAPGSPNSKKESSPLLYNKYTNNSIRLLVSPARSRAEHNSATDVRIMEAGRPKSEKIKRDYPPASGYPKCVLANANANGGGANKLIPVKKHFPVSTQEWDNSIYAYNIKNTILLSAIDKMVIKLIKSYFNAYMAAASKKRLNRSPKLNLSVLNKRYVSKPEIKHTNSKVIITIYKYISKKYMGKIKKIQSQIKSRRVKNNNMFSLFGLNIEKNKYSIRKKLNKWKKVRKNLFTSFFTPVIRQKKSLLKKYKNKKWTILGRLYKYKVRKSINLNLFFSKRKWGFFHLKRYINNPILVNGEGALDKPDTKDKEKFYLSNFISELYYPSNKVVYIREIRLKYLHLNTSILVEYLANKLTNKIKILKKYRGLLKKIKLPLFNIMGEKNYKKIDNNRLNELSINNISNISIENLEQVGEDKLNEKFIINKILSLIKYKALIGVRFEIGGRLTRRNVASMSVFKIGQKGTLKNINSSYRGLSVPVLRGHVRPNLDYSSFNSTTSSGSFGVKAWGSYY